MSAHSKLTRRNFVRLCASAVTLVSANPALLARADTSYRRLQRVQLLDDRERPLAVAQLKVGETYLFHYPYLATPCFLLDLGTPAARTWLTTEDGQRYLWDGGIGPRRSIVAFSAICAHKMTHPAKQVSFINYRHERVAFENADKQVSERAQVIYCCSEKSVYDPVNGARVLGGPAKQPLAAIVLEQDAAGALYAVGTTGGELFERFFREFAPRLELELRTADVRKPVDKATTVMRLADYCRNQVLC